MGYIDLKSGRDLENLIAERTCGTSTIARDESDGQRSEHPNRMKLEIEKVIQCAKWHC
jgi:hypothetical protein